MILLKTSGKTIGKVVEEQKHALRVAPRVSRGELILISQTEDSLRPRELPVQYVMTFVRCYPDRSGESLRLWGKRWPYIIQGENCRRLKRPFRMSEMAVSGKTYGRGFTLWSVDPEDEAYLEKHGYLENIAEP